MVTLLRLPKGPVSLQGEQTSSYSFLYLKNHRAKPIGTPIMEIFKYWYISFLENGNSSLKSKIINEIDIPEKIPAINNPRGIDMQR